MPSGVKGSYQLTKNTSLSLKFIELKMASLRSSQTNSTSWIGLFKMHAPYTLQAIDRLPLF